MADPPEQDSPAADPLVAQSWAFVSTLNMLGKADALAGAARPQSGQLLAGRYQVREQLGAGGMGSVYRVFDQLNGAERALKLAHQRYAASEDGHLLFRQEFLVMASLQHPSLPHVLDYGFDESGAPFLVMELVAGAPVPSHGRMPLPRFYRLFIQFLQALGFLHARGFLHRDIKPANAMIVADGGGPVGGPSEGERLVLLDFGLMDRLNRPSMQAGAGTPAYMPPEVVKGRSLDARTDLYSLGIVAYEMLTGQRPFRHANLPGLLQLHELAERPHVTAINDEAPPALDELICRLMAASPADRPTSADDVLLELTRLTDELDRSDQSQRRAFLRLTEVIGREPQLAAIDAKLREASEGRRGCLLLEGVTGAGKSRLLHEAQVDALVRGFTVSGVSVREEHRSSYHALRVLLRGLLPAAKELKCPPPQSNALSSLLPAETPESDGPAGSSTVSPQEERGLVIAETAAWLEALSAHRPVLLIADDLQWCDESSLLVLMSLSRRITVGGAVVLLGAYRADEVDAGSDLNQWRRFDEVTTVPVSGFDETQMESFLTALLGRHELDGEFIHRSTGLTDGRPFFVIEVLRELIDVDVLVRRNGVWRLLDAGVALPGTVAGLITRRIDRLTDFGRGLALRLAVAGGVLPLTAMECLCAMDRDALLRACEELIQQRVAEQTPRGLALIHDSIREVAYESSTSEQRRDFHLRLAEYYQRELNEGHPERVVLLGHHFTRGGERLKGLAYLESAGQYAFQREQHGVARDLLVEAEQLLIEAPDVSDRDARLYRVRRMLMAVGVSNEFELGAEAGEWVFQAAVRRALPAMSVLQRVLPAPFPLLGSLVLHMPFRFLLRGRAALTELESNLNDVFLASGYLCNALAAQSLFSSSRRRAERLRGFAISRNGLPAAFMEIAQLIGKYHQEPTAREGFQRALRTLQRSRQFRKVDAYSQGVLLGVCHYGHLIFDAWQQDPEFADHYRAAEEHATQSQNEFCHHINAQVVVENEVFGGNVSRVDRAESRFLDSLQIFGGKAQQREWLVQCAMGQFEVCCGRFDRAARRAARLHADGPGYFTEGCGALIEAKLKFARGDHDAALRHADRALRWARDPEVLARLCDFRAEAVRADALIQLGRDAEAADAIRSMQQFVNRPGHSTTYFSVEVLRRRAELARRIAPDDAPTLAREALHLAPRNASRQQVAEAHVTLTNTLSDDAQAQDHLRHAAAIYSELGNGYQGEILRRRLS